MQFQFLTNIPLILSNIFLSRIKHLLERLPNSFQNIARIPKIPISFEIEKSILRWPTLPARL